VQQTVLQYLFQQLRNLRREQFVTIWHCYKFRPIPAFFRELVNCYFLC